MNDVFLDANDPELSSWVESANDPATDFPIQNLPFGRFRREEDSTWCIGVAIGAEVLDLRKVGLIDSADINRLIRLKPETRRALRQAISEGLRKGSATRAKFQSSLVPQSEVTLGVPCNIHDYTDFYVGIHHATAIGKQFRPDSPLLPNYKWVPIGYHGRASTINPSGSSFARPLGQAKAPGADCPVLRPSQRLDFELELGIVIGRPNAQGVPVPIREAEDHVFGFTLWLATISLAGRIDSAFLLPRLTCCLT